ncbi:hypothetical protein M011DRAFT_526833 [Sporormia fimetaria CBS 119925]|uniref:Uncharacterized protein n=1 Tax=Sporormia fimetaria CBS 119925 TaxID=1340428 RepID=A0A6A6VA38_9PLEO|nr:hypothetical protein M011DRAFT_526833 [Sporormia fimetaria CBS 119925]
MHRTAALLALLPFLPHISASPDPVITPLAHLHPRQNTPDPSILGFISTSGQSDFSDLRSCDYPATLSTSGTYAQCCTPNEPCIFWSICSDNTLKAESTSVFCDQGYCNTAVMVATPGAEMGEAVYMGCWATSLGQDAFTIVRDLGVTETATVSADETVMETESASATETGAGEEEEGSAGGSESVEATPSATGAAARVGGSLVMGAVGLVAGLL